MPNSGFVCIRPTLKRGALIVAAALAAYLLIMLCFGGGPCIFCGVISGDRVVYKDEKVAAFEDIRPAAPFHYLVVPLEHVQNGKSLLAMGEDGAALLNHMVAVGEQLLKEKGYSVQQARMGFHWPPFNSVGHLHLHVIAPTTAFKSKFHALEFRIGTPWFKTADWVLQTLGKRDA